MTPALAPAPATVKASTMLTAVMRMQSFVMLLLLLMEAFAMWVEAQAPSATAEAAPLATSCVRACGTFETCFVYDGAEYCAHFCAPGRCNDATEMCVLLGRACDRAPCLPVAICEPKSGVMADTGPEPAFGSTTPSTRCMRSCPMVDAPVCASDGVSYANACFFAEAQCLAPALAVVSRGLCAEDRALNEQFNAVVSTTPGGTTNPATTAACDLIICSDVYDPVCTTRGTMHNLCFFKKARCSSAAPGYVELISRNACEGVDPASLSSCPTACTQAYDPVCASNGVLYGNDCLFRQAKCARRAYDLELRVKEQSFCVLRVGDSDGTASDLASILVSIVS